MSDIPPNQLAIKVDGLGKCYHLYEKPLHRVMDLVFPGPAKRFQSFWALKDASFEITAGQTVGIIGRNGSGKSTLLEMVCNTLQSSTGQVQVNGRIAALLELGAGFNPEFTGRENVYMNAAIMGIDQSVIDDKLQEIADFANIGEYINYPVKTYSSGMFVRLAFATSINLDPDILIVDEALAVGDIRFQRKCFREFDRLKRAGKTILFVTHAIELIRSYCDWAILLDQGKIICQGEPRDVVHEYLNSLFGTDDPEYGSKAAGEIAQPVRSSNSSAAQPLGELNADPVRDGAKDRRSYNSSEYRWGEGSAQIIDYLVTSKGKSDPLVIEQSAAINIQMRIYFKQALDDLIYGITFKTLDGTTVYGANTRARKIQLNARKKGELVDVSFNLENHLITGSYFVSLGVAQDDDSVDNLAIDRRYDLFSLLIEGRHTDMGLSDLKMIFEEKAVVD